MNRQIFVSWFNSTFLRTKTKMLSFNFWQYFLKRKALCLIFLSMYFQILLFCAEVVKLQKSLFLYPGSGGGIYTNSGNLARSTGCPYRVHTAGGHWEGWSSEQLALSVSLLVFKPMCRMRNQKTVLIWWIRNSI